MSTTCPASQGRCQGVLDVSLEDLSVGGALHGHSLAHPTEGDGSQEGGVLAAVARHRKAHALALWGVTIKRRERGM